MSTKKFTWTQEECSEIATLFNEHKLMFVPPVGFFKYQPAVGVWSVDTNLDYTLQVCKSSPNPVHAKFAEFISSTSIQKVHDFLLNNIPTAITHPSLLDVCPPYQLINTPRFLVDLVSGNTYPHSPTPIFTAHTTSSPASDPNPSILDSIFKFITSHFPDEEDAHNFINDLLYSITALPPHRIVILHLKNPPTQKEIFTHIPTIFPYIAKALYPFAFVTSIFTLKANLAPSTRHRNLPHPPFPYHLTPVRVFILLVEPSDTKKDLNFLQSPVITNILTFSPLTIVSSPMNVSKPPYSIFPSAKFIFVTSQLEKLLDILNPTISQYQLNYKIYPFVLPPKHLAPPPTTVTFSHLLTLLAQKLAPLYFHSHPTLSKLVRTLYECKCA